MSRQELTLHPEPPVTQLLGQKAPQGLPPYCFLILEKQEFWLSDNQKSSESTHVFPERMERAIPVREDDLLHVVGHEEVVEAPALVPLHEGFLGPGRTTARVRRTWWGGCGGCRPTGGLCCCSEMLLWRALVVPRCWDKGFDVQRSNFCRETCGGTTMCP